jgi:hypothetical protein
MKGMAISTIARGTSAPAAWTMADPAAATLKMGPTLEMDRLDKSTS